MGGQTAAYISDLMAQAAQEALRDYLIRTGYLEEAEGDNDNGER